jgi:hypothetical protein
MKRSIDVSEHEHCQSSKSVRDDAGRRTTVLIEQRVKLGLTAAYEAEQLCGAYNGCLPFASQSKPGARLSHQATAVSNTVKAIRDVFARSQLEIQELTAKLDQQVDDFAELAAKRARGFMHGNLLGECACHCATATR